MNVHTLLRLTVTTALVTGAAALGGAWASAQGLEFEQVATITGPAELVEVRDDVLYVTNHTDFSVYDISDPASPRQIGALSLPEEIWGFRIQGDRAYIGANFHGLAIVDISDPTTPTVLVGVTLGSIETRHMPNASSMPSNVV